MKEHLAKSSRIDVIDALRGMALLAIVLLHNLEHYNLYHIPAGMPEWLNTLDRWVWDSSFFLMAGKAFSTFSLLFGFSFFIQIDNQARKGNDFRGRFAWRLLMLMLFAQLHALFYDGDILLLYAVCGFSLIAVSRLSDKAVLAIAVILLLQPFEWGRILYGMIRPEYTTNIGNLFLKYARTCFEAGAGSSLLTTLKTNITDGQLYSNLWQIENGRLFQVPALFMFGLLLGRWKVFVQSEASVRFWKRILTGGGLLFLPLYIAKSYLPPMIGNEASKTAFDIAFGSYVNFVMMGVFVAMFVLLWFGSNGGIRIQRMLIPYGRMSLTNYIVQSVIGCTVYYGYGFGLWKTTGAAATILIGAAIFAFQLWYSKWWLSRYQQGPLESLWKKLTWIRIKAYVPSFGNKE